MVWTGKRVKCSNKRQACIYSVKRSTTCHTTFSQKKNPSFGFDDDATCYLLYWKFPYLLALVKMWKLLFPCSSSRLEPVKMSFSNSHLNTNASWKDELIARMGFCVLIAVPRKWIPWQKKSRQDTSLCETNTSLCSPSGTYHTCAHGLVENRVKHDSSDQMMLSTTQKSYF